MDETCGGFRMEIARIFYPINDNPFGIDREQREEQEERKKDELLRLENRQMPDHALLLIGNS